MKATLYVKGVRTKFVVDASYQGYVVEYKPFTGQPIAYPDYRVIRETKYKSVLPEDQKAAVEMVKAAAVEYGFDLKVIDAAEKRFLDKFSRRSDTITTFPTLVTDTGFKIEGSITEEGLKDFFVDELRISGRVVRDSRVKLRLRRGMLSFYTGVFILTAVGLAVLHYGLLVLPGWYQFLFVGVYIMAWIGLPALTVDFTRNKLSAKKILVLTLGVMLVSTLFTHLVWTIAAPNWSFSISTNKSTYKLGETVIVTASLRNVGFIPHYFTSIASDPILFAIDGPDTLVFSPFHENTTLFSLSANQSLERTFTWDQTHVVKHDYDSRIETCMPGTYQIHASIPDAEASAHPYGIYPPYPPLFLAWTSINITSD